MKNRNILIAVVSVLLFSTNSQAQEPGDWTEPKDHPCYQGIKISVANMGQSKDPVGYRWGIRFFNAKYNLPVSFKYKLSIGEKVSSKEEWKSVSIGKGDNYSDAHDKFTAWIYPSSSETWYVYIWDVCFDGMRCGGEDECFAECDKTAGKENQLCGLSEEYKPTPGANQPSLLEGTAVAPEEEPDEDKGPADKWEADDKTGELQVIKKEDGLLVKLEGEKEYRFFKKIGDKTYRHEAGKDFDIIKFSTDDKFSYWHNGELQNHYTLVTEDDGESKVRSGIWTKGLSNAKVKITVTKEGLTYHSINSVDDGSPFFKRVSSTEYRLYDRDGILFNALTLKEDGTLHYTFTDKPDSYVKIAELVFLSAEEEEKPTNEEDKYSFKGTTIWKYAFYEKESDIIVTAQINGGLIELVELGWPSPNIHIAKLPYKRVAPDKYQEFVNHYKNDSLKNDFLQFISSDKLVRARYTKSWVDTGYYKKEKRGKYEFIVTGKKDTFYFRYDTLTLAAIRTVESLPKATTQIVTPADVTGTWRPESKWLSSIESFKVRITPLGENMLCNFGSGNQEKTTFTYKKISVNTYEYKTDNGNGAIGRLVFLSPTRICLSYVYKNYVSIGYYNKPAAPPIVKQENKPVTVTENKTTSTSCGDMSGEWIRTEENAFNISHPVTIKTTSDGLSWSSIYQDNWVFKKISATSYKRFNPHEGFSTNWEYSILSCENNSVYLRNYQKDGSSVGVIYKLHRK